jgi:membrane fusion protein, macrolide-specific efflux system
VNWKASRRLSTRAALAWIAGGTMLACIGYWLAAGEARSGTDELRTVRIARDTIEELVTAQGKLEAKEYVDVGTQVSGQLRKLHVAIGDSVKAGDLLAELDPRVYEAQVEANEARLKSLAAQLSEQQAQRVLAEQVFERNRNLIRVDAVSQQMLQESEAEATVARARISATHAQMAEVRSNLAGIRTNLGFTKIVAPMSGSVTTLLAREGQTLNANQTAPILMQVSNLDTMTVRAQVAEADVSRLRPGMPAYFTTLGDPEHRWEGSVRQILPSPETLNDVVLYHVLIDVSNDGQRLMTGMSAQVFFVLGRAQDVAVIPSEALGARVPEADDARGKAFQVRVQTQSGVEERVIHTGLRARTGVEVTAGLREGERIALPAIEVRSTPELGSRGFRGGRFGGGPVL